MFDFENYHKAESIEDAVKRLNKNPDFRLLAGGTDMLVRLREGHKAYRSLLDIHHLAELKQITKEPDGTITIGSGVTFTKLLESALILKHLPVLAEGAASIGGPQVRNAATIGGNICNGAPSADSAAPLLVLNAEVVVQGPGGTRHQPLARFYLGPGRVDLKPAEIVTGFRIASADYAGFTAHFIKYAMRNAMDIATIGCAASLKLEDKKISELRLAYTVAGPTPLRCPITEKRFKGMTIDEDMIKGLKHHILDELNPRDSWRAAKDFREHIIVTLTEQVVRKIAGLKGEE